MLYSNSARQPYPFRKKAGMRLSYGVSVEFEMNGTAVEGESEMPKMFKTDIASEADVKVFVTDIRSEADLVVYETTDQWAATESTVWCYTDTQSEADKVVYFTGGQWEADVVIYRTDIQSDAEWVNSGKESLL